MVDEIPGSVKTFLAAKDRFKTAQRQLDYRVRKASMSLEDALCPEGSYDPDFAALKTPEGREKAMAGVNAYISTYMLGENPNWNALSQEKQALYAGMNFGATPGEFANALDTLKEDFSLEALLKSEPVQARLQVVQNTLGSSLNEVKINLRPEDVVKYTGLPETMTGKLKDNYGVMATLVDEYSASGIITPKTLEKLKLV